MLPRIWSPSDADALRAERLAPSTAGRPAGTIDGRPPGALVPFRDPAHLDRRVYREKMPPFQARRIGLRTHLHDAAVALRA
jgi:hypothetical protein